MRERQHCGMRFRITTFVTGLLLATASGADAQTSGRVEGRVLDQTGGALPGVAIDLVVGSTELTTTSDVGGQYRFEAVPAGTAELTYRVLNFSVTRRTVDVAEGKMVAADIAL